VIFPLLDKDIQINSAASVFCGDTLEKTLAVDFFIHIPLVNDVRPVFAFFERRISLLVEICTVT
jgi:hypothetical protein